MTKREKDLIRGAWIAWGISLALIFAALLLVHGCAHERDLDGRYTAQSHSSRLGGAARLPDAAAGIAFPSADMGLQNRELRNKLLPYPLVDKEVIPAGNVLPQLRDFFIRIANS